VGIKKLLAIAVLGLLWSGNVSANNLIGKQLKCGSPSNSMLGSVEYLKFINDKNVEGYSIHNETLKVRKTLYNYINYPSKIEIEWIGFKQYTISRKTLKTQLGQRCEIVKFNIKDKLEKESEALLKAIQKDNKI
tara:strand:+ start:530 stop:931 length:402 start_codon:yes stop_codon:yes gene_type:complete